MSREEKEKTCADCKCRNCSPITAMAERMDAWHAARNLLNDQRWAEDYGIVPADVVSIADWLLTGGEDDD